MVPKAERYGGARITKKTLLRFSLATAWAGGVYTLPKLSLGKSSLVRL